MHTIRFMSLLIMVGLITGCTTFPRFYLGADEIHGKVVDAETKQPIKDVVVVAVWELYGGIFERQHTANLVLRETVTDEDGNYSFDSWGPRFTISGYLEDESPDLIFYKFGYKSEWMNDYYAQLMFKDLRWYEASYKRLEWSGRTLELKKFVGTPIDYSKVTSSLDSFLEYGRWYRGCDWKRVPRYTAAMVKLTQYLASTSAYGGPSSLTLDQLRANGSRCGFNAGEVDKLLGEYLNE